MVHVMAKGLSDLQQTILRLAFRADDSCVYYHEILKARPGANIYRTLRSLEDRGLVMRIREAYSHRAGARLTEQGKHVAQTLSDTSQEEINESHSHNPTPLGEGELMPQEAPTSLFALFRTLESHTGVIRSLCNILKEDAKHFANQDNKETTSAICSLVMKDCDEMEKALKDFPGYPERLKKRKS